MSFRTEFPRILRLNGLHDMKAQHLVDIVNVLRQLGESCRITNILILYKRLTQLLPRHRLGPHIILKGILHTSQQALIATFVYIAGRHLRSITVESGEEVSLKTLHKTNCEL